MSDISKIDMERINGLIEKLDSMKYVVETGGNGNGWYRVWSDGWIEQGNNVIINSWNQLLKPFTNTDYYIGITRFTNGTGTGGGSDNLCGKKETTQFWCDGVNGGFYFACGY